MVSQCICVINVSVLILQINKCVRSFISAGHVIRFANQRTNNFRNKTIKGKCIQGIRQYGKIVSQVSIYYYYCLNRRSVIFLYWRLPKLSILSTLSFFFPQENAVPYISKDLGQLNCSWNIKQPACSWNNKQTFVPGTTRWTISLWLFYASDPHLFPKAKSWLIFIEQGQSLYY